MKSYSNVINLFKLSTDKVFVDIMQAIETFKNDPDVSLEIDDHSLTLLFDLKLSKEECENIYIAVNYVKPIGVSLYTNKINLFNVYVDNYPKACKFYDKVFKAEAKLTKAKRKLNKFLENM